MFAGVTVQQQWERTKEELMRFIEVVEDAAEQSDPEAFALCCELSRIVPNFMDDIESLSIVPNFMDDIESLSIDSYDDGRT